MHEVSRLDKPAGCIHQLLGHGSVRWMRFAYPPYPSEACAVMHEVSRVDKPAGRIHQLLAMKRAADALCLSALPERGMRRDARSQ
jgi:hypothetical protein